jgi:hypothetical protein
MHLKTWLGSKQAVRDGCLYKETVDQFGKQVASVWVAPANYFGAPLERKSGSSQTEQSAPLSTPRGDSTNDELKSSEAGPMHHPYHIYLLCHHSYQGHSGSSERTGAATQTMHTGRQNIYEGEPRCWSHGIPALPFQGKFLSRLARLGLADSNGDGFANSDSSSHGRYLQA